MCSFESAFLYPLDKYLVVQAILKRKRKAGDLTIMDFKLYYKDVVIKMVSYWHKNRHKDQWNRIENPEIEPQVYGQLIFNKAGKNIQWKKRQSLQQMMLGNLDSNMQNNEMGPFLTPYTKINSKWMKDLNVKQDHQNPRGEHRQQPL